MPTYNGSIAAAGDDGFDAFGSFVTSPLQFGGYFGFAATNVGMRFLNVDIDQGETINSATVTINVTAQAGAPDVNFYGADEDNSATFGFGTGPSTRTQTTAVTNITSPGTGTLEVDVTDQVQEIIDRGGWSSGNALSILAVQNGANSTNFVGSAYDSGADNAILDIDYGTASTYTLECDLGSFSLTGFGIESPFEVVTVNVVNTVDDGYELSSTFTNNSFLGGVNGGASIPGAVRFRSLNVPQGVTIGAATLTVNVTNITSTPDLTLYGVDEDDADLWTTTLPSAATLTTESLDIPVPGGVGIVDYDITDIVQEIIDRGGWSSGNDIGFVFDNNAGSGTSFLQYEDLTAAGGNEASLQVTYSLSSGTSLEVDAGSFTLTGQDTDFVTDISFECSVGSFTLTGQDAEFLVSQAIIADLGEFILSGQDVANPIGTQLSTEVGAFILSGQDIGFLYSKVLSSEVGSFTLDGGTLSFYTNYSVGNFVLEGKDVTLSLFKSIDASVGSFTLSGQDADFNFATSFIADVGSFVFKSGDADTSYGVILGSDDAYYTGVSLDLFSITFGAGFVSSFEQTGGVRFQDIQLGTNPEIVSASLVLEVGFESGNADVNVYGNDVDNAATWSGGNAPQNITQTTAFTNLTPDVGIETVDVTDIVTEIVDRAGWNSGNSIAFGIFDNVGSGTNYTSFYSSEGSSTGEPPVLNITSISAKAELLYDQVLTCEAGSFLFEGADVLDPSISANLGSFVLSGQDIEFSYSQVLAMDAGAFALNGQDTGLFKNRTIVADTTSFILTGQDIEFLEGDNFVAETGSFSLSGQDQLYIYNRIFLVDSGAFTLTGQDIVVSFLPTLIGEVGTFELTGQDTTLYIGFTLDIEFGTFSLEGKTIQLTHLPWEFQPETSVSNGSYTSDSELTSSWTPESVGSSNSYIEEDEV